MIVFQSVSKQFSDDQPPALSDVSFEIEKGELVVITGSSGSGKTTLMRLLTCEYQPSEGEVYFANEPLSAIRSNQVHHHRRRIGVIFQDYKLLPELNIWENIALPLYITGKDEGEIEERVTDLLNLVDLTSKAFLFPSQLSGGEAQRVSIARALATGPSVLFADEPTGNLDAVTTHTIAKLIQKIHELGTTVLITTHDITVLDMLKGERVLMIEKGRLVGDSKANKKTTHHKADSKKETTHSTEPDQSATNQEDDQAPSKPALEPAPEPASEPSPSSQPKASPHASKGPKLKLPRLWPTKKNATETSPAADDDVDVKVEEL